MLLFCVVANNSIAQISDTLRRELTIDLELRPRAEYRENFMWTPVDAEMPGLQGTQRNRLSITYQSATLKVHASPQEIHQWGLPGKFSSIGNLNFFELYVEPRIAKDFLIRLGRQALSLDNGRIFSAAPWAQQSRAHEGIRFLYKRKFETDLTIAFTRPYSRQFDPAYSPVAAHTYKYLVVHHFKHKFNSGFTLTTINALDAFDSNGNTRDRYHERITNGGRLEYGGRWLSVTASAYYQHGQNASGRKLQAYYIQPEMSAGIGKTQFRLGMEILSGNNRHTAKTVSASFVPLYGVAWKFMGNMNLFTRFPADVNEKGLVNPYLFVIYQVGNRLSVRADAHLFYSQFPLLRGGEEVNGTYLGFETDLSFNYKPVKAVDINYGLSFTVANERMELLRKVPDSARIPVWSYLMVSYAPRLLTKRWMKNR